MKQVQGFLKYKWVAMEELYTKENDMTWSTF